MDVAATSMAMSASNLKMQVSYAVMKQAMQTGEDMAQNMVDELIVGAAEVQQISEAIQATGHLDAYV